MGKTAAMDKTRAQTVVVNGKKAATTTVRFVPHTTSENVGGLQNSGIPSNTARTL